MQWDVALDLANEYPDFDVQKLFSRFGDYLLKESRMVNAIQLLYNGHYYAKASSLVIQCIGKMDSWLDKKKGYVLYSLMLEKQQLQARENITMRVNHICENV